MSSSNLPVRLPQSRLPVLIERQVGRELARIEAANTVAKAADRARIDRVGEATQRGVSAVAAFSAVEGVVLQAVPHAEARLRAVADAGAVSINNLIVKIGQDA